MMITHISYPERDRSVGRVRAQQTVENFKYPVLKFQIRIKAELADVH